MQYYENLWNAIQTVEITNASNEILTENEGFEFIINRLKKLNKNKVMAIGNGGSAAIASHLINDLCKTDQIKAVCFSDYSYVTCMANDYGYERVYENAIDMFAEEGDLLVAISSSGNSENIIRAVNKAKEKGCFVIGLSGFNQDNKLRKLGNINIYVPKNHYGYVELAHQIILHMITDTVAGLTE